MGVQHLPETIRRFFSPARSRISRNFRRIDEAQLTTIEHSIRKNYHTGWRSEDHYSPRQYRADVEAHLRGRLDEDRKRVIPWIEAVTRLENKRVLEIGCGTGSSTIALAEQGARVTGIDIDEGALLVAEDRAKAYEVQVDLHTLAAQHIGDAFETGQFDIIIFFACLEHMTIRERLTSLRHAWQLLPLDGLLVVADTPNRLWHHDGHTSMLPFFHWLPNELAFEYSKFSPRDNFRELYRHYDAESKDQFLRRGRGVSFHEFELTIGPATTLDVVSSLSSFEGIKYRRRKSQKDRQYKRLLMRFCPRIHEGFFDDALNLVIRKGESQRR